MNHRITKKALKALVDHAGDASRVNLACIFASTDGSVLVATDGIALLLRHDTDAGEGGTLPAEAERKGRTIDLDACKRAIKLCSARGRIEINAADAAVHVYERDHETAPAVTIDASRPGHEPGSWDAERDGFPPYRQVIPPRDRGVSAPESLALPPAIMARMFGALMPKHTRDTPVRLSFGADRLDPVRVDVKAGSVGIVDGCAWVGVLMPIYSP